MRENRNNFFSLIFSRLLVLGKEEKFISQRIIKFDVFFAQELFHFFFLLSQLFVWRHQNCGPGRVHMSERNQKVSFRFGLKGIDICKTDWKIEAKNIGINNILLVCLDWTEKWKKKFLKIITSFSHKQIFPKRKYKNF